MLTKDHLQEILEFLRENNANKVFVQVPEGLKMKISFISDFFTENGIYPVFSVEPCFGACDLKDHEAKMLGCDNLLHIGHADFGVKAELPVIYYELKIENDFTEIIRKNIDKLQNFHNMGIMTTIQYADEIPKITKCLEEFGKDVFTGKNQKTGYEGHVLGCDYSAITPIEDKVDCFIYFGSGLFHPGGFDTEKPVFSVDIERNDLRDLTDIIRKNRIKRELSIEKARGLKDFAVYVSTKRGQMHADDAFRLKEELEYKGKNVVMVSADMLSPDKLTGLKIDVIVNTACPRISQDGKLFGKVIINKEDANKI